MTTKPKNKTEIKKNKKMNPDLKKLPKFKNEAEERRFWSLNDFADYAHEFEELPEGSVKLDPKLARKIRDRARKKHLVAIRLSDEEYAQAQKLALEKSFGLSTLIRSWIAQGIARELKSR